MGTLILSCVPQVIVLHYLLLFTIVTLLLRIILPPIPNPTKSDVQYNPCSQFSSDLNNTITAFWKNISGHRLHNALFRCECNTPKVVWEHNFGISFGTTSSGFHQIEPQSAAAGAEGQLRIFYWVFLCSSIDMPRLLRHMCFHTPSSAFTSCGCRGQCRARRLTLRGRTSRGSDTVWYFGLTAGEESEGAIVWPSRRFRKPFLIPACPFQDGSPWLAAREKQRSQALRGRRRWGTNLQRGGGGDGLRAR